MNQLTAPFICHVLVCINDRKNGRQSCAHAGSPELRKAIKAAVRERGLTKAQVRVSQTLCLGKCGEGPNVMIYPQDRWFSKVTLEDVPAIVEAVETIVDA